MVQKYSLAKDLRLKLSFYKLLLPCYKLIKCAFLSCRRGTLSREDTLDNATYPMATTLMSKTNVTWLKVCLITLWMVDAYPATIGWYFWPSAYALNTGIMEVPLCINVVLSLTYFTFPDNPLTASLSLHLLSKDESEYKIK